MTHLQVSDDFGLVWATVRHRRLPSQARSRQRVKRLLDSADELIGSEGFAALTIPALSARAALPVGTIYQFYPDKSAVVDAVAARYMQLFLEELQQLTDSIVSFRWNVAVDTVVERFAGMYRHHPTFRELWLNGHLSQGARERDRRNNEDLAAVLARALRQRREFQHSRRLKLACRTAVEVADALLRYAFTVSPHGNQLIINELKRLLTSYFQQHVAAKARKEGRPAPHRRADLAS